MGKVIGIDLGTTNSCIAVMEGGEPVVISNGDGERITPSVVTITAKRECLVGTMAKRSALVNAENTVLSIKRFMGRRFHEPERTPAETIEAVESTIFSIKRFMGRKVSEPAVEQDQKYVSYRISEAPNQEVRVSIRGRQYSPPEVSAMILRQLKAQAEAYLGEEVIQAVITVPAYFNDSQRQATKEAGAIAGLEVLRILNEPTAAALAYGLDRRKAETIAVYDLGGGTFDISILELCEGTFEVKAVCGDTHLGGDDIDQRIMDWLCRRFLQQEGIDLRQDPLARQRLKNAAERAKVELGSAATVDINLPFIARDGSGPKHLQATLNRSQLEAMADDIIERTMEPCRQALADAGISAAQLDAVCLVGGQTRMPLVREKVRLLFGKEPDTHLNPEEVVAIGAAVQAGVLAGEVEGVLLLDVTPLTLGIETEGGIATPLIRRNTTIPTSRSQVFTTAEDNQPNVEISVVQGERAMAVENKSLGRFSFDAIERAPRGVPRIEVTFTIDANGIVQITADDQTTGQRQSMAVSSAGDLSQEEIARLAAEAELHAETDVQRREEIRLRNEADGRAYLAEELLSRWGEMALSEVRAEVEGKVGVLRRALQGDQMTHIQRAKQDLEAALALLGYRLWEEHDKTASSPAAGVTSLGKAH